jgi:outer membrane protein TolC
VALGREPSVPVLPADDLTYQPVTVSLEALKALALQRRPEIVAAQSRLVARQFAVKSARAQWLPDFLLLAHFGESERALRVTAPRLAVGIALPFFDFGRIRGEIRAAKAQVTEQEALLEQTKRVILAEVETAVKKLDRFPNRRGRVSKAHRPCRQRFAQAGAGKLRRRREHFAGSFRRPTNLAHNPQRVGQSDR